jgi:hypothetical protein
MIKRILLHVDVGPAGAALRFALGFAFARVGASALPGVGWATQAGALALALFGVKVAAAVARRFAGATPQVKAAWEWRRNLARFHDSYQVRKLLWIGAGILAAGWIPSPAHPWGAGLGGACVVAGVLAEVVWRRKGLTLSPPERK